ncbi:pirin family protein [Paenibacillus physcomitrellae]|uniref:Quercetin 2,3-dioxygenase n=1 Tax=Paenibacillus physcomitrellae TaxID=1619311 RepID=A0ABQ1FR16_9BACL|nr:pirin family protein [Paenibacillus physcomitrellae]GGA27223.1 quercetin 2,3-dioxygenase [Paenibacillus physcomitrellae]
MITLYPDLERNKADMGWLKTGRSFSFGDYQDENNMAFEPLRVFNDDVIAPGRGFGAHPHSDMEIVSIVLSGQLRHEDSMGNEAVTTFGGVQRMSAGSGVIHTEHNPSQEEEVNLLQIWFMPSERGKKPSYTTSQFDPEQLNGRLLPVVTQEGSDTAADIGQDLTIYMSRLQAGEAVSFHQEAGRRVFLFVIEGRLSLQHEYELGARDSARIVQVTDLEVTAKEDVLFMLIDLP